MNKEKGIKYAIVVFSAWAIGYPGLVLICQFFDLPMPQDNGSYVEEVIATVIAGYVIGATWRRT